MEAIGVDTSATSWLRGATEKFGMNGDGVYDCVCECVEEWLLAAVADCVVDCVGDCVGDCEYEWLFDCGSDCVVDRARNCGIWTIGFEAGKRRPLAKTRILS